MNKRKIDLSDIKKNELDNTVSFTDLMSRSERRNRRNYNDDIEDMIDENKKNTKDLTIDLESIRKENKEENNTENLEFTKKLKLNFEEIKEENVKTNLSLLNIVGILNLICIGFYLYVLIFTSYQDNKQNYTLNSGIIILLVLLFGISIVTKKKISKFFNILNIFAIIAFIIFNILSFK